MKPAVLWRATRAYALPASVVPVLLGTVLAARGYGAAGDGRFNAVTLILVLLGAVLAHFGANVINDYFDFVKGVDTRPEHGSGVLTGGQMTATQTLNFSLILFAGAALCGLALLPFRASVVVPLTLVGLACAILYSAFLKKYALGDPLIVLAFGLGLTVGAYGVQTPTVSLRGWLLLALYSLPICLLVDAILHANNLRDARDDRAANVRTLATLLPRKVGEAWQHFLLFGPLVFVALGVVTRFLPLWSLATFLSLPFLIGAARSGSVQRTAQTHFVFGLLYTISLLFPPVFL